MKELITGKYTIKQIFKDHWASYLLNHKPSEHTIKTVNKMLNCREPSKIGYHQYSCLDHPGEITIVPHSCKSKFCNICGAWQTDKWMAKAMEILPETTYYHITLTIPDYLWYFLRDNMPLLDLLFKASAEAVQGWFKERNIIPAICSNLRMKPENIWYFYRGRAVIEKNIREIKENFALAKIPTKNFLGNQFYFHLLLFAYNIVNWFKRICLPPIFRNITLETLRTDFLVIPARLVKSDNRNVLKLPAEYIPKELLERIIQKIEKMKLP